MLLLRNCLSVAVLNNFKISIKHLNSLNTQKVKGKQRFSITFSRVTQVVGSGATVVTWPELITRLCVLGPVYQGEMWSCRTA